mmetsp:Transcript_14604/g.17003  ORF Transcript_14604/g.17003 Transcript_14604/m.17003 type:complete len:309 (-) Transcript_14604:895-1821(-)
MAPTTGAENEFIHECSGPFSQSQTFTIKIFTFLFASLSVVGSFMIIFSYWYFHMLRTFPYKLIVFLSIANLFSSIGYFFSEIGAEGIYDAECNETPGCIVSAIMTQFFDVANFFWTSIIAFNIYAVLVKGKGRAVEYWEKYYHMISWGLSGVLAVIVGASGGYGDAGIWCWIVESKMWLRFFCYYLPLVIVMTFNIVVCLIVMRAVRDSSQEAMVNFRLRLYVFVFIFVRMWSIFDRLQNAFNDTPVFSLALLHSIFSPMQGIANALVYGCNYQVVQQYRYCCDRNRDGTDEDTERLDGTESAAISVA